MSLIEKPIHCLIACMTLTEAPSSGKLAEVQILLVWFGFYVIYLFMLLFRGRLDLFIRYSR
jgi:hypothetical protein